MQFEFSPNELTKISVDATLVFSFENKPKNDKLTFSPLSSFIRVDSTLEGQIINEAKIEHFTGKKGEFLSIIPKSKIASSRIVLVGLGTKETFTVNIFREVLGAFSKKMKRHIDSASLTIPTKDETGFDFEEMLHAAVEGVELGRYVFMKYKKKEENERVFSNMIIAQQKENTHLKDVVVKAQLFAKATKLTRDLVNEQSSVATPTYLANLAKDIAKGNPQIVCKVYDKEDVQKMGMNAFLGVARAADTPPKFVHLEYTPKNKGKEKIALVGKGITFDSGGINVKPGEHMNDMKMDMAGAAAVLGIFSVIAEMKPQVAVMGIFAATPNMISGASLVPGDVVKAMNGKTIEIINTDAEGRVTMADSLSYAVREGATKIIDMATLTGAAMVSLGEDIASLFSNNKELAQEVLHAAQDEGEKMWEMPLERTYKELNKSAVADIANLSASRYGGTITAALFLEEFIDNKPWVHLDIAGPAFLSKGNELGPKGGTGIGVRTVLKLLSI